MSDWKNLQYKDGKMRTSEGGGGGGSSTFAGLDDVSFSNLQNGQVPKYNSTTRKWENADESGGGGTVIDVEVDGVSVVDPQTGVANITMPTPPTIPVEDVEVNGTSVVNAQNVAEIKSYKEITQAEYNALPASKTSDDILYCIKDSAGADGFPPLIYSDEEREVGVWRDGRPLYQKVLRCTFTESDYDFTIDASFQIKMFYGIIYASSGEYNFIHLGYGNISADKVQAYQYSSTKIRVQNSFYGTRNAGEFILQYTKTTDTAGSGTWTTQGALAHHYSTDEHIIGTWTDGKPIYEKTFQLSNYVSIPTKSWTTVMDVSNLSISKLIRCDFIDMEGVYWSGALNRISNGNLQSYIFEGWPVKELTLQYTKNTD